MSTLISQIATKQDLNTFYNDIKRGTTTVRRWMFILWLGQIGATMVAIMLIAKK